MRFRCGVDQRVPLLPLPLRVVAWALNQAWAEAAWSQAVRRWAIITGVLLAITAVLRLALFGVGKVDPILEVTVGGALQAGEPLIAGQAILLLIIVYLLQSLSIEVHTDLQWAALLGSLFW